jgi:hypothetical protein
MTIMPDHIYMAAIIPPKLAVAEHEDIEKENGDSRFPTKERPADKAVLGKPLLEPQLLCHDGRD